MQTFLPYPDFRDSAQILDYRRLGKQRLEAKQILNALLPTSKSGWRNHPAVRMWEGYEDALRLYHDVMIEEWILRGYNNNMPLYGIYPDVFLPDWIGDERLHASHRANLLRKDPIFYGKYGWSEDPEAPYWWPIELKNRKMNEEMNRYWNETD